MKICTWAEDSDLYCYEFAGTYYVHVRAMRPTVPSPDIGDGEDKWEAYLKAMTPIGLSRDGTSYAFVNKADFMEALRQLKIEGYRVSDIC